MTLLGAQLKCDIFIFMTSPYFVYLYGDIINIFIWLRMFCIIIFSYKLFSSKHLLHLALMYGFKDLEQFLL